MLAKQGQGQMQWTILIVGHMRPARPEGLPKAILVVHLRMLAVQGIPQTRSKAQDSYCQSARMRQAWQTYRPPQVYTQAYHVLWCGAELLVALDDLHVAWM